MCIVVVGVGGVVIVMVVIMIVMMYVVEMFFVMEGQEQQVEVVEVGDDYVIQYCLVVVGGYLVVGQVCVQFGGFDDGVF